MVVKNQTKKATGLLCNCKNNSNGYDQLRYVHCDRFLKYVLLLRNVYHNNEISMSETSLLPIE